MLGRRQQIELLRRYEERLRHERLRDGVDDAPPRAADRLPRPGLESRGASPRCRERDARRPDQVRGRGGAVRSVDDSDASPRIRAAALRRRIGRAARAGLALRVVGGAVRCSPGTTESGPADMPVSASEHALRAEVAAELLRAYDAAAISCGARVHVTGVVPAVERLSRVARRVDRIGSTVGIALAPEYHALWMSWLSTMAERPARAFLPGRAREPDGVDE